MQPSEPRLSFLIFQPVEFGFIVDDTTAGYSMCPSRATARTGPKTVDFHLDPAGDRAWVEIDGEASGAITVCMSPPGIADTPCNSFSEVETVTLISMDKGPAQVRQMVVERVAALWAGEGRADDRSQVVSQALERAREKTPRLRHVWDGRASTRRRQARALQQGDM